MKRNKKHKSAEEINAELARLFESDVKEFSENGAKAFGHILAKHGIDDPQKWLEHKMRYVSAGQNEPIYSINKEIRATAHVLDSGEIEFVSLRAVGCKETRAHELAHKIMREYDVDGNIKRCGFMFCFHKKSGWRWHGKGLSEGVTDLLSEKLNGKKRNDTPYFVELFVSHIIAKLVGEDTVFEAAFFDNKILANALQKRTKIKHTYDIINSLLDFHREGFDKAITKVMSKVKSAMNHGAKLLFCNKYRCERRVLKQERTRVKAIPVRICDSNTQTIMEIDKKSLREITRKKLSPTQEWEMIVQNSRDIKTIDRDR